MRIAFVPMLLFPFLVLPIAPQALENPPREFRAARGEAAITVLSEEPPSVTADPESPAAPGGSPETAQAVPIASIEDFTSLRQSVPAGEALLEVYFREYATGKVLRFPLKYSELRRFLTLHPADYPAEDIGERNVAFIRDLSEDLRIRMKALNGDKGGKGK